MSKLQKENFSQMFFIRWIQNGQVNLRDIEQS